MSRKDPIQALMDEVAADARDTARHTGCSAISDRVMGAMSRVPRDAFVPETWRASAWLNRPFPIGHGQTVSQPFIVALMTDVIDPAPHKRVLEIGTGSGYQAAILAELVRTVYTIETIPELAAEARARLKALGYDTIHYRTGDGAAGWPEEAPFDAILVTAAPEKIPETLTAQLAPGGRMVIPVGKRFDVQRLMLVEKAEDSAVTETPILPVAFVPLVGGHDQPQWPPKAS